MRRLRGLPGKMAVFSQVAELLLLGAMKLDRGPSILEEAALLERAKLLGLSIDAAHNLDPASMKGVKGGVAAVEKAAGDQTLSLDEAAKLDVPFLHRLAGRGASTTERATNTAKSLILSAGGLLARADNEPSARRFAEHFREKVLAFLDDPQQIGRCDPEVLRALAEKLAQIAEHSSAGPLKETAEWLTLNPRYALLAEEACGARATNAEVLAHAKLLQSR